MIKLLSPKYFSYEKYERFMEQNRKCPILEHEILLL